MGGETGVGGVEIDFAEPEHPAQRGIVAEIDRAGQGAAALFEQELVLPAQVAQRDGARTGGLKGGRRLLDPGADRLRRDRVQAGDGLPQRAKEARPACSAG